MKNRLILLVLLVAGFFLFLFFYNKYRVAPSLDLFSLPLTTSEGVNTTLEQFKGKKLIVTFYASWCRDCLVELRALNEVKNTRFPDTEVICITDDPLDKMISFMSKKNYPFHFFRVNTEFSALKINAIPVNYLINSSGQVVMERVGAIDWNDNDVVAHAINLLK